MSNRTASIPKFLGYCIVIALIVGLGESQKKSIKVPLPYCDGDLSNRSCTRVPPRYNYWSKESPYKKTCGSRKGNRSPIAIYDNQTTDTCSSFEFYGSGLPLTTTIRRKFATIEVLVERANPKYGGGFSRGADHRLTNIYFRFGCDSYDGTEHLINGKGGAMEMQLYYKDNKIIAVRFLVVRERNEALQPIVDALQDKTDKLEDYRMLDQLIPNYDTPRFYNYNGTDFKCRNAEWFVMDGYVNMSYYQKKVFEEQLVEEQELSAGQLPNRKDYKCPMPYNFFPPQPLNGRTVLAQRAKCYKTSNKG